MVPSNFVNRTVNGSLHIFARSLRKLNATASHATKCRQVRDAEPRGSCASAAHRARPVSYLPLESPEF